MNCKLFFILSLISISINLYAINIDKDSAIILADKVNVREKPLLDSKKIVQLNKGDYVMIKEKSFETYAISNNKMIEYSEKTRDEYFHEFYPWYKIKINNKIGWAYGKYLGINIESSFYQSPNGSSFKFSLYKFNTNNEIIFLWFISCPPGSNAADNQGEVFKIVVSNNSGHRIVEDFEYYDSGDSIKEIQVLPNKSLDHIFVLIDSFWQCLTDPCNGQRIDILGFSSKLNKVKLIFSNETFDSNFHSDYNSISYVDINQNIITVKNVKFKRKFDNAISDYMAYNKIAQRKTIYIFNDENFKFEEKEISVVPIKGITKSETKVFNDHTKRNESISIPTNTEVRIKKIKDPLKTIEDIKKDNGYWIYIISPKIKGWINSNDINFEDEYLSYYFNGYISNPSKKKDIKLYTFK